MSILHAHGSSFDSATARRFDRKPTGPARLSGHLPVLDGLRGLAILLVLVYHFALGMTGEGWPAKVAFKMTSMGWCGVDLFFVLSGFLITGILHDAKDSPNRFRNFYARRALRIFPLYYGTLAIVFLTLPVIKVSTSGFDGVDEASRWLWSYGTNILVALRGSWFPLSHFWSLAVEEHFYLIWPAVVFGLRRETSLRICGLVIATSLLVRIWLVWQGATLAAYCLTICRMDALAMGGFIALAVRGEAGLESLLPLARRGILICGALLLALIGWRVGLAFHDSPIQAIGYPLLDLFFASLLVLAVSSSRGAPLGRLLGHSSLRYLGKYSYGLYVYNSIAIMVLGGVSLTSRLTAWSGSVAVARILYVSIAAASTFAAAWLSWNLYERHFLKLKALFN